MFGESLNFDFFPKTTKTNASVMNTQFLGLHYQKIKTIYC